ncbi:MULTISPECIES: site-specific integrase [unclassified Paenibacillus]|uniref:tyrosine-type recombinase/integrase n=1 Tax=unclassified Paenibacillus TaxID=185978 RepID=UPI00020D7403|nr:MULTISPECIES: site-specific integrase [unclassified Paenibacillus]EGL17485.1 site-specific recombinase, phage integrase family [Paenibacillus sp. HGF7]EPD81268.1 hypothetical protein HMPREF1207_05025 [Paenibacillus sp. HGH0039]
MKNYNNWMIQTSYEPKSTAFDLCEKTKVKINGSSEKIECIINDANEWQTDITIILLIRKGVYDIKTGFGSKPAVKKGRVDFWTVDEVKEFLDGLEHRHRIIFVLAIYTGMRRGEILGLRWRDIDLVFGQIRISQILAFKGEIKDGANTVSGNRSISTPPIVVPELRMHRTTIIREKWETQEEYKDYDLVVCRKNGMPVSWSNFHKFWLRILSKTKVRPIRFHDLRHTCASILLSGGIHPKIVQELLGHSSIKITLDTYSHMMPNIQADAVKTLEKMLN